MVAQVIVDVAHTNVAKPFSYLVPEGMALSVGCRVRAPLGRRQVDGFVTALLPDDALPTEAPRERLRPVTKVLDSYPALFPALIALAEELAAQAHCPLCETLRLMLPSAMRTGRIQQKTEAYARLAQGVDAAEAAESQRRAPKRAMLIKLLADGQPKAVNDLKALVNDPGPALKALEEAGLVALERREVFRAPDGAGDEARTAAPELTHDQREALEAMLPSLRAGRARFCCMA